MDAMEIDLEGKAVVVRLNLSEDVGRQAARRMSVSITPTFIVFLADGDEHYRESGPPDIDRLKREVLSPG